MELETDYRLKVTFLVVAKLKEVPVLIVTSLRVDFQNCAFTLSEKWSKN